MVNSAHLNLPNSTQWISFPTVQHKSVLVAWNENHQTRNATYYVTKCYWGTLKSQDTCLNKKPDEKTEAQKNNDKPAESLPVSVQEKTGEQASDEAHPKPVVAAKGSALDIIGETTLFIASEYVEPDFSGGTLANYHIKDLAGFKEKEGPRWITIQLNDCFHYGQFEIQTEYKAIPWFKKWKRWIVYHPPAAPGIEVPQMYQHRFTGNAGTEFAKMGLEALPELAPNGSMKNAAKAVGKVASVAMDLAKGVAGDPLRRFLGPKGVFHAMVVKTDIHLQLETTTNKKHIKKGSEITKMSDEDRRITALQFVELQHAKYENEALQKQQKDRIEWAAKYLRILKASEVHNQKYLDRLLGPQPMSIEEARDILESYYWPSRKADPTTVQKAIIAATLVDVTAALRKVPLPATVEEPANQGTNPPNVQDSEELPGMSKIQAPQNRPQTAGARPKRMFKPVVADKVPAVDEGEQEIPEEIQVEAAKQQEPQPQEPKESLVYEERNEPSRHPRQLVRMNMPGNRTKVMGRPSPVGGNLKRNGTRNKGFLVRNNVYWRR